MEDVLNHHEEDEEMTVIEELPENNSTENDATEENIFSNQSSFKNEGTDPRIYSARAYFSKQIALTRDRAAAFFLDVLIMSYLLGSFYFLFQNIPEQSESIPTSLCLIKAISKLVFSWLIVKIISSKLTIIRLYSNQSILFHEFVCLFF